MRGLGSTADLVGLSLESTAAPGLPAAVFQRLATCTLEINPRLGLTGELRLEDGRFALVLEGRGDLLLPLAARILADRRHARIRVTEFGAIAARRFASWRVAGFEPEMAEAPAGTAALRFTAPRRAGRAASRPPDALRV
jgi:hypothetical protein